MTTVSAMLGRRTIDNHGIQVQRAADQREASFESEMTELVNDLDAQIAEHDEAIGTAATASDDIVKSTNGAEGLSDLIDNTVAIYGDAGIPEEAAQMLEVSVECVLRSMGMYIPASAILPSLEGKSRSQYSTEAEEKKEGIIARIWEMIKKAFAGFGEFITNMLAKLRNNINAVQAYSKRVRERVETIKGATPTGDVKLGGDGNLTKSGEASQVVSTTHTDYKKFIDEWSKHWDSLISQSNIDALASGNQERIRPLISGNTTKLPASLKWPVTPFHTLEITPGSDAENALGGAKAKVISNEAAAKETSFKHLSIEQMKATLDSVDAVLLDLTAVEKDVSKWNDTLKKMRNVGRLANVAGVVNEKLKVQGENEGTALRKAGQALTGGCRVALDGFSNTSGPVMKVLRANLVYVAKSANGYGKPEGADKPEDNPEEKKPEAKTEE